METHHVIEGQNAKNHDGFVFRAKEGNGFQRSEFTQIQILFVVRLPAAGATITWWVRDTLTMNILTMYNLVATCLGRRSS
jgi:hypothetical protein